MRRALRAALLAAALGAAGPAFSQEEDLEDLLGGFEDESGSADEDLLGGFDDAAPEEPAPASRSPLRGEWWEVTGSVSVASSINYVPHRSATGTNYYGLSKLRTRLNLQIDADLPRGWELRAEGFGYYDWAYRIHGRQRYTRAVLHEYEWDADTQEVWLRGSPFSGMDVKIGRQVVNWGRSENLRVLDVINPVDNREPGIADIEDLRRPVTMGRFDFYRGAWNLSILAIPEIRFNQNPPVGSDFNPVPLVPVVEEKPSSLDHWEAGVGLTGIFEGWDVSFHFAYYYDDFAVLESTVPLQTLPPGTGILKHSRLWMLGSGGNYTLGSWLFKGEIAYVDGLAFTQVLVPAGPMTPAVLVTPGNRSRLDVMVGVEYYGFADTTFAIEALNRHIFDFPSVPSIGSVGGTPQEDETQASFRLSRTFLRERLDANVVAILLSGNDEVGSVVRIDASYDLRDALTLTAGVVLYQENDLPPLDSYGDNDRFFFELKYSF